MIVRCNDVVTFVLRTPWLLLQVKPISFQTENYLYVCLLENFSLAVFELIAIYF